MAVFIPILHALMTTLFFLSVSLVVLNGCMLKLAESSRIDCIVSPRRNTLNGFKCPPSSKIPWDKKMVEEEMVPR